jgi:hypothetical protein
MTEAKILWVCSKVGDQQNLPDDRIGFDTCSECGIDIFFDTHVTPPGESEKVCITCMTSIAKLDALKGKGDLKA